MRPAMIVQCRVTKKSDLITVMPLSTKVAQMAKTNVLIPKDQKNKLTEDSVVMTDHIMTFDRSRFLNRIGETSSPVLRRVRGALRRHFLL